MKTEKDVKRKSKSDCILFRVEEEEEEYKNKEREVTTDQSMNSKEENSHYKQYSH